MNMSPAKILLKSKSRSSESAHFKLLLIVFLIYPIFVILYRFKLVKQPIWNYKEVAQSMHYIVRSTGYSHHLEIDFPIDGGRVEVRSNSQLSKIRQSTFLQGLACLSCAWVCLVPMYLSSRKREDCCSNIAVDYMMKMSPEEFYTKNYWPIFFRVTQGNKGHFKVQT